MFEAPPTKDVQIHLPKPPHTDALLELCAVASESEVALMIELAHAYSNNKGGFKSDSRLGQLSAELRRAAIDHFSSPEPHGPPHVFVRGTFPTDKYLERLFRTDALSAIAHPPGEPKAYELTKADWAVLEIAYGGDLRRLGVWRSGKVSLKGEGDFENVRVEREAVIKAFPADPPRCHAWTRPINERKRSAQTDSPGTGKAGRVLFPQEIGAGIVRADIS